jgi:alpha-tubulin suppressor-like RCC1 family protein
VFASASGPIGLALSLAPGVSVSALAWTITGPSGPYSGTVQVGAVPSVEFVTGGIPAGGPYTLTLSGSDSAGEPCSGSGRFDVAPGVTSEVSLVVSCVLPTDAGVPADVEIEDGGDGGLTYVSTSYNCPAVASVAASPSRAEVGEAVQLEATTTQTPGGAPGTPTFAWSVDPPGAGVFTDDGGASPVFQCAEPGSVTVTVTDGLTASVRGVDAGNLCKGVSGTLGTTTVLCLGPLTISAGGAHTCAVLAGGSLDCWGLNGNGQLGTGTTAPSSTPVAVTGLAGAAIAVAAGEAHTCAIITGGGVQCWGANSSGQLGNGSATDSWTPVAVSGLSQPATALAAGASHTCALLSDGSVQCWGNNGDGQLGNATDVGSFSASPLAAGVASATAIAAGLQHTCALLSSGGVSCWGDNSLGQLGGAQTATSSSPVAVQTPAGTGSLAGVQAIGSGPGDSTCAALSTGAVDCWGSDSDGQLAGAATGSCSSACSATPVSVSGISTATAVASGGGNSYALVLGGGIDDWGDNGYGELGSGSPASSSTTPVAVDGVGDAGTLASVVSVAAGGSHACALLASGAIECWGDGANGQLGNGALSDAPIPVTVIPAW